jgi:hypothetical protein
MSRSAPLSLLVLAVACAQRPQVDGDRARVARLLDDASSRVIVGQVAQPVPDYELGIIAGARLSPDGKTIAVLDEVPPNVKVFSRGGAPIGALHFDRDTNARYVAPIIALSNKLLLVLRPDLRRAEVFAIGSRRALHVAPLDFAPIAAVAVGVDAWLVYGPSGRASPSPSTWVHCLEWTRAGELRIKSALTDSMMPTTHLFRVPVLTTTDAGILFAHRVRDSVSVVEASCGTRAPGAHAQVTSRYLSPRDGPPNARPGLIDLGSDVLEVAVRRYSDTSRTGVVKSDSTLFHLVRSGHSLTVPGRYQVLDSRPGIGVAFLRPSPVPAVYVVSQESLRATLLKP